MPVLGPKTGNPIHGSAFNPQPHGVAAQGVSEYPAMTDHVHPSTPGSDLVTNLGSATLRWLLGYFGNVKLFPPTTATAVANGEVTFEFTNATTLTIRTKGSDGTARSVALTLS